MPSYEQLLEVRFAHFTTAARDAEWPDPPNDLVIFNTTTQRLEIYIEETWQAFVENPDAADITYTPAVLTDWDGDADPGNVDAAQDQLAERLRGLEPLDVLTTRGDLLTRSASAPIRLPLGPNGTFLYSDGQDTGYTDEEIWRWDEDLGALIEGIRLHGSVLKLPVLDEHPDEDEPETGEPVYGSLYVTEDDELWYMDPDGVNSRVVLVPEMGAEGTFLESNGASAAPAFGLVPSSSVELPVIGSPTYTTLEHLNDTFHSAGWVSGGVTTDAGSETVNVAAGAGYIRDENSRTGTLLLFDWAAANAQAIATDTVRYVGVEYNAGSPQVVVRTSKNWNYNTDFPLAEVVNEGGTLHIQELEWAVGDHADFMIRRILETDHVSRDDLTGGLILGETGTRNITVSAGALWIGLNRNVIAAIDTSVAGTFDTYSAGGQEAAGATQWPNAQYDNSGTLATMTNNWWANLWWYMELDGALVMVYGTGQFASEAQAENDVMPTVLPDRVSIHAVLIARTVFKKSAATIAEILSAFTTTFASAGVTDHGNLVGLTDDDHTQYVLKALFDAQTVLAATTDDTPAALTVTEQTVVGRLTGGNVAAVALGIADDAILQMDDAGPAAVNDYLKLTAAGAAGRTYAEARADIGVIFERSITVEDPTNAEDITIAFTNRAITITEMRAVLIGTANGQTVTWTIRHHATDRSNAGSEVVTGGTTTTSLTAGSDVTAFNDATIPADSFIWLETTAKGGTVTELHVTLIGTID